MLGPYPYPKLAVAIAPPQSDGIEFPAALQFADVGRAVPYVRRSPTNWRTSGSNWAEQGVYSQVYSKGAAMLLEARDRVGVDRFEPRSRTCRRWSSCSANTER